MVFTLFGLLTRRSSQDRGKLHFLYPSNKTLSNSAEHTFLLITINVQASTDTGRDTVRDQTRSQEHGSTERGDTENSQIESLKSTGTVGDTRNDVQEPTNTEGLGLLNTG